MDYSKTVEPVVAAIAQKCIQNSVFCNLIPEPSVRYDGDNIQVSGYLYGCFLRPRCLMNGTSGLRGVQ